MRYKQLCWQKGNKKSQVIGSLKQMALERQIVRKGVFLILDWCFAVPRMQLRKQHLVL